MKHQSIPLKCALCALTYLIFVLLLFFVVYTLDCFEGAFWLGIPCGALMALLSYSDSVKRTLLASLLCLLAALLTHVAFELLGVPYAILTAIFSSDSVVGEVGRLTINEIIGYGWGRFFLWGGLLLAFVVSGGILSTAGLIKNRRETPAGEPALKDSDRQKSE